VIWLGNASSEHYEYPCNDKIIRIQSLGAHWILEPLDGGKRTRLTNISELHFGGNVPKSLVQTSASERQITIMAKLRKHLMENFPN